MHTRSALVLLTLALLAAGPAHAAEPKPRAMVEDHLHNTGGEDWHVQLEVSKSGTRLGAVVVYAQRCKATGFVQGVVLGPNGTFQVDGTLPGDKGSFTVSGQFTGPVTAEGTWNVTTADCTQSGAFTARDSTGHFLVGNPYEYPPDRIEQSTALRKLTAAFRRNAPRFTAARARALGYSFKGADACPSMIHARKRGTVMWGKVLDPSAPQSLMYWCGSDNRYILAGAMFRAPGNSRPKTYGNLIQWHKHATTSTANWMTHLWLTPGIEDAWATCTPFRAYEEAGMFTYQPWPWIMETKPCSDTPGLATPARR